MKILTLSIASALAGVSVMAVAADLVIVQPNQEDLVVELVDAEDAVQFSADGTVTVRVAEDLTVDPIDPTDPPSCFVPDRSVTQGNALSYNISNYCTPSAGESLNLSSVTITSSPSKGTTSVVNGTISYTADPDGVGPDSFRFTVADGSGNVSASTLASISITESGGDGGNENCDPNDLTHNLARDTRHNYRMNSRTAEPIGSSAHTKWATESGGSNPQYLAVPNGQYAAMEFTTGSQGTSIGKTNFEDSSAYVPEASNTVVSISECPGQFDPAQLGEGCYRSGFRPSPFWKVSSTDTTDSFTCHLKPNTTYYLNYVNAAGTSPAQLETSSCDSSSCGAIYVHRL